MMRWLPHGHYNMRRHSKMKRLLIFASTLIVGWLVFSLALTLFVQSRDYYGANPILRPRLEVKEPFQSGPADSGELTPGVSPGAAELEEPRKPYALLDRPLAKKPLVLTAQGCHTVDFLTRLEKTGNFRQMTNNYRRDDPDSCSGWTEELNLSPYERKPLPFAGCISAI